MVGAAVIGANRKGQPHWGHLLPDLPHEATQPGIVDSVAPALEVATEVLAADRLGPGRDDRVHRGRYLGREPTGLPAKGEHADADVDPGLRGAAGHAYRQAPSAKRATVARSAKR